jgi:hypothetical protein
MPCWKATTRRFTIIWIHSKADPRVDVRPTGLTTHMIGRKERTSLRSQARRLFTDILSYKNLVDANRPMRVLYTSSPTLTETSITAEAQYEQTALLNFFAKFGVRIYQVELSMKNEGLDTSSLDSHLAQLVNTQVLRLVALDLEGMAEQLGRNEERPNPGKPSSERTISEPE